MTTATPPAAAQATVETLAAPGRLVDLGGYRLHLWCSGSARPGRATVVLSIGGGGFAVDWSLVQGPLSDSGRVCSYDRPGWGWSEPGPYPRTLRQEAFEVRNALRLSGETAPYVLVGQSLGAFVARRFAADYPEDVVGVVLAEPTNENGKLGYRGRFVLPRTLATDRQIPAPRPLAASPPVPLQRSACDSNRARAERSARIVRPFDQLGAAAQRYRLWARAHPSCVEFRDDYFAEEMAWFYDQWSATPHPLGDLPVVVILGTQRRLPPPGLSEAEWRSDSMRIDLSRLSRRGSVIADSNSGHHIQLDNPTLVVQAILALLAELSKR